MPNFRRAEVTSSENEGLKMIFLFFPFQLRRMQEMLAQMQKEMAKQKAAGAE